MAAYHGTLGRLLVESALPASMRGRPDYVLDKKGLGALLAEVARDHPEQYPAVSKRLGDVGRMAATASGGQSFGVEHLIKPAAGLRHQAAVEAALNRALDDDTLDDRTRGDRILKAAGRAMESQRGDVYREAVAAKNPLAMQVLSGARGNQMNLSSLLGSDLLYTDHKGNVIPLPVTRSYSQGLTPEQYWAGTYGARKGVLDVKLAVRDAGALSKTLNQLAHRLVVTGGDSAEQDESRGLPVDADDPDNEGTLLARAVGPYPRNTVLGPKVLKHLRALGHDRILVRSPIVGGPPEGGLYSRDVGVREQGTLPGRGEMVGLTGAQSLSEPLSQGSLSSKHSGGIAGAAKAVSGFAAVNQQIQVPRTFKGGAAHAEVDGRVQRVAAAPAGGQYVTIEGRPHYVQRGFDLKVKPGDDVEAGDVISEGLPNPAMIVKHKGIGEGRRYFAYALRRTMTDAGITAHRRNTELLARGLINHVTLTDETEEHVPGDVLAYSALEHSYTPREGAETVSPRRALGKYLERPVLHYTIGTPVRPSVVRELGRFGVDEVHVHEDPPPFEPEMIRGMAGVAHDPDWMTRMYGSGQKASLLDAVHHGATSDELGTSFVPSLARAVDFGRKGFVRQPEPGKKPEEIDVLKPSRALDLDAIRPRFQFHAPKVAADDAAQIREARAIVARVAGRMAKQAEVPAPIVDHAPSAPVRHDHALGPAVPVPDGATPNPYSGGHAANPHSAAESNPWAGWGDLSRAKTPPAPAAAPTPPATTPQSFATQALSGAAQTAATDTLGLAGNAGYLGRGGRLLGGALVGRVPAAGLRAFGGRVARGTLLWNAGTDAVAHGGEAADFYGGVGRGAVTGDWSNYNRAAQQNAAAAHDQYRDVANQGFLGRMAAPFLRPLSTAQALVGARTELTNARSDLGQEQARSARLDQQLARHNAARLGRLAALAQRGRVAPIDPRQRQPG